MFITSIRRGPATLTAGLLTAVIVLTGCSSQAGGTAQAPPGQPESQPAGPAADESGLDGLQLLAGTAKANKAEQGTGDWAVGADGTPNTAKRDVASRWVQLKASAAGALDPVVVNGAGLTLYRFDKDTAKPSKSNCDNDCAVTWPPVIVRPGSRIFVSGVRKGSVATVKRADGTVQVTVGGWPVYRFAKDVKAGDTKGQGVGGTWFGVTPAGGKAGADTPAATPPGPEAPTTTVGNAPPTARNAILFDDARFSDDGASQGISGSGCQDLARPGVTSSVSLLGTAKLWSAPGCTGQSVLVDGDVADLAAINFDNKVASVGLAG